jgi:hypothetical protein
MTQSHKLRRPLLLATLFAAALLVLHPAQAQQRQRVHTAEQDQGWNPNAYYVPKGARGVGGYSLTFSDIWGPAKMPPAPTDFGPHFDYPPESLNSAPLHDPYPN